MTANASMQAYIYWLQDRGLAYPALRQPLAIAAVTGAEGVPTPAAGLRLAFVSDTPMSDEERDLLTKMAQAMRLGADDIAVLSALAAAPSATSMPDAATIAASRQQLLDDLQAAAPEMIVTLGGFTTRLLLGERAVFQDLRGKLTPCPLLPGRPVLATFHPRELLRVPGNKRLAWTDLQLAMAHLGLRLGSDA